jgi:hypothetical protein
MAELADEGDERPTPREGASCQALAARRQRLLAMRRQGVIGDVAFHRMEEELGLADLAVAKRA